MPEPARLRHQPLAWHVRPCGGGPHGHCPRRVLRRLLLVVDARDVRGRTGQPERNVRPRRVDRRREEPALGTSPDATTRRAADLGGGLRDRRMTSASYPRRVVDGAAPVAPTRGERRDRATADTRARILV